MSLIHQSTSSRTVWMKHRKIWALQLRSYLAHQLQVVFLAMVTALFKGKRRKWCTLHCPVADRAVPNVFFSNLTGAGFSN